MNNSHYFKVSTRLSIALISIASVLLPSWATGQNVYRCGNSYSQTPCPGGETIGVNDARDADQKRQTDNAMRLDERRARALEKARIAQEKSVRPNPSVKGKTLPPGETDSKSKSKIVIIRKIVTEPTRAKTSKSADSVAQVPDSKPKAEKKTIQKGASSPF